MVVDWVSIAHFGRGLVATESHQKKVESAVPTWLERQHVRSGGIAAAVRVTPQLALIETLLLLRRVAV
jgi:hypothetical protein